ncbi:MAG: hypothetical protein INF95_04585 [Roseomonas sp.]|nr:hypothetical protein [Roseomonas sp.]MCA3319930.1 hypothetical protein [Roseomonas sp.]
MPKALFSRLGLPLCLFFLVGCAQSLPKLDAEKQWREAMGNLGMLAIYPPSEDIMVGDAFLFIPGAQYFDAVRLTSAPGELLAEHFCWQEQDRPRLDDRPRAAVVADEKAGRAATAASLGGVDGGLPGCVGTSPRVGQRATTPAQNPIQALRRIVPYDVAPANHHLTRLREEAIPTLEVGRFTEGEIGGAATFGNFGLNLNAASKNQAAMRVELRELQSATLEEIRGQRLIELIALSRWWRTNRDSRHPDRDSRQAEDYPNALTPLRLARSLSLADDRNGTSHFAHFCRADFAALDRAGTRILVANRVLYAGGVTFDFMSRDVLALRATLDFASVLANRPQAPQVVPFGTGTGAPDPQPGARDDKENKGDSADKSSELDKELARTLALTNNILTMPGAVGQAQARLTMGRFGNLALQRDFRRPAAVGMGAALHFPIRNAALPVHESQIVDAIMFCRQRGFRKPDEEERLKNILLANLRYVEYLVARNFDNNSRGPGARLVPDLASLSTIEDRYSGPGRSAGGGRQAGAQVPELPPSRLSALGNLSTIRVRN